jgi:hypothetical protein
VGVAAFIADLGRPGQTYHRSYRPPFSLFQMFAGLEAHELSMPSENARYRQRLRGSYHLAPRPMCRADQPAGPHHVSQSARVWFSSITAWRLNLVAPTVSAVGTPVCGGGRGRRLRLR